MTTEAVGDNPQSLCELYYGDFQTCFHDTDCSGAGICALNQTWMQQSFPPNIGCCICPTKLGVGGTHCTGICVYGWLILVTSILTIAFTLGVIFTSASTLVRMYLYLPKFPFATPTIALTLTLVTGISLCICSCNELVRTIGFKTFALTMELNNTGRQVRRVPTSLANLGAATYAIGFAFGKCSFTMLPMIWIDLVQRSLSLKPNRADTLSWISISLMTLILVIEMPLNLHRASQPKVDAPPWTIAAITLWGCVCIGTMCLNGTASIKVSKLLRQTSLFQHQRHQDVRQALEKIMLTASALVVLDAVIFALMISGYFRSFRTLYSNPRCIVDGFDLSFRLSILALVFTTVLVNWSIWNEPGIRKLRGNLRRE